MLCNEFPKFQNFGTDKFFNRSVVEPEICLGTEQTFSGYGSNYLLTLNVKKTKKLTLAVTTAFK